MTDARNNSGPEDWEALAAEYALGVLEGTDAQIARQRMRDDPVFESTVWQWRERLAPLADRLTPVAPSPAVWQHIAAALAAENRPTVVSSSGSSSHRRLAFWRGWAIAASAAAAVIALVLGVVALQPTSGGERLVAVLDQADAAGAAWLVAVETRNGDVSVRSLAAPAVPVGKSHELWFIGAGAERPVSLGLLSAGNQFLLPPNTRAEGAILAVSLEPDGGSPTGQPTGPVLFQGALRSVAE